MIILALSTFLAMLCDEIPRLDNDICLYGVFDGIGGSKVSAFASQNMPAEILLGQLANKNTDEDLKELLRQVR